MAFKYRQKKNVKAQTTFFKTQRCKNIQAITEGHYERWERNLEC